MTKICLRLLFIAAAVIPLAHGCGDSSFECLGTPVACENREIAQCGDITCESLTDRPMLCVQTGGCRYLGSCTGRAGCENVEYEACGETPGCVQVARCAGDGVTCSDLEDSQCELHPECFLGESCVGSADSCASLGSTAECRSVPGCFPADTKPAVVD
jgi:hypothetical protein